MSLKYIVPTLGLLAVSAPTQAVEIGGYVDSILAIESTDETRSEFNTTADLTVGYSIGDSVSAFVELYADESAMIGTNSNNSAGIVLQNAYVSYAISDTATITMGKFDSWIGWEGLDAPDLWRTNLRNTVLNTFPIVELTGVNVAFDINEQASAGIYIVDNLLGVSTSKNSNFGFGGFVTYTAEGLGAFDFDIAFNSEVAGDGSEDLIFFSANGQIDALADDGLTLAYDFIYSDWGDSEMEIMVAANYVLADEALGFPASVTAMLTYSDSEVGDTDETEFAFALLTNPTGDANFAVNGEVKFIVEDDMEDDTFGLYLEALAIIP